MTASVSQVELVARACCEYMKAHFHPTNCLAVRTFAESHNRVDLMDMADRYACEHFTEVVECEDFTCVSPQHLRTLLSSNELNIHSETQVYNAAVKWLKANPQHHDAWLDLIMSQVRLHRLHHVGRICLISDNLFFLLLLFFFTLQLHICVFTFHGHLGAAELAELRPWVIIVRPETSV